MAVKRKATSASDKAPTTRVAATSYSPTQQRERLPSPYQGICSLATPLPSSCHHLPRPTSSTHQVVLTRKVILGARKYSAHVSTPIPEELYPMYTDQGFEGASFLP